MPYSNGEFIFYWGFMRLYFYSSLLLLFFKWAHIVVFVSFATLKFFFLHFHRQLNCFSFFLLSLYFYVKSLCAPNREKAHRKREKKYAKRWTQTLMWCLKREILFLLHMLSGLRSNTALASTYSLIRLFFCECSKEFVDVVFIAAHRKTD